MNSMHTRKAFPYTIQVEYMEVYEPVVLSASGTLADGGAATQYYARKNVWRASATEYGRDGAHVGAAEGTGESPREAINALLDAIDKL